ncbi:hypothetical protein BJ165DRAFT_756627 [Panaeolus papilionaceus]|nr:hypothetical protein BJ165DRAFT_756627 [Panaeolus papilionaceus]
MMMVWEQTRIDGVDGSVHQYVNNFPQTANILGGVHTILHQMPHLSYEFFISLYSSNRFPSYTMLNTMINIETLWHLTCVDGCDCHLDVIPFLLSFSLSKSLFEYTFCEIDSTFHMSYPTICLQYSHSGFPRAIHTGRCIFPSLSLSCYPTCTLQLTPNNCTLTSRHAHSQSVFGTSLATTYCLLVLEHCPVAIGAE